MATSVSDQATTLLSRRVAEARTGGVPASEVEARAVFDLVTMNLVLHPRAVFFILHLARNGLLSVISDEIGFIDDISSAAADLGNVNLSVRSSVRLERMRTALLQFDSSSKVDPSSGSYLRFDNAVSEFLAKDAGSLRKPGATGLTRPGPEAASDLATAFSSLRSTHADLLDRLYAFTTGASNFFGSPVRGVLGLVTAGRIRQDIESYLDTISKDGSLQITRDLGTQLITARATLRTLGSPPSETDPVLSSADLIPTGYELTAESEPTAVVESTEVGPFTMGTGATIELETPSGVAGPFNFPQDSEDLDGRAWVVSDEKTYPVVVPADSYLFLLLDGTQTKIPITAGSRTLAQLITEINGFGAGVTAAEFAISGTNRLALIAQSAAEIKISVVYVDTLTGQLWDSSIHDLVGFSIGQTGDEGPVTASLAADALEAFFEDYLSAKVETDGTILITGEDTSPGTYLTFTGSAALGLEGTSTAQSAVLRLLGTVNGVPTDPVDVRTFLSPGDTFETPSEETTVSAVTVSDVTLSEKVRTFSGNIRSESLLTLVHSRLVKSVNSFLSTWKATPYAGSLSELDRLIAATTASKTASQRSELLQSLGALRSKLVDLQTLLTAENTLVPATSGTTERAVVSGILATFVERKYDRAEDLLLRGKVLETVLLDEQSASFGGQVQKAMSSFGQTDLKYPDRSKDEGLTTRPTGSS